MNPRNPKTGWQAAHGGLFLALVVAVVALCPTLPWPWYLLLPVAGYAGLVLLLPPLRRSFPRLSLGRADRRSMMAAVALAVLTSAVLLAYQALLHPDVTDLAARLPVAMFGNLCLAGLCFSVANAVFEEVIFRGVLYEAVAADWGTAVAVGVTAVLFGLGHVHGSARTGRGRAGGGLRRGPGVAALVERWPGIGRRLSRLCRRHHLRHPGVDRGVRRAGRLREPGTRRPSLPPYRLTTRVGRGGACQLKYSSWLTLPPSPKCKKRVPPPIIFKKPGFV
jgi:membrane protease YdiL (CAAX protease family)